MRRAVLIVAAGVAVLAVSAGLLTRPAVGGVIVGFALIVGGLLADYQPTDPADDRNPR